MTPRSPRVIFTIGERVFVTVPKEMCSPKECDQIFLWDAHFIEVTALLRGPKQAR